jgi:hypothetical protein
MTPAEIIDIPLKGKGTGFPENDPD